MAKKNKSDMAKGIRRSILNDGNSVDTEKESDANLQAAASIAKIAVTLDGFTAATLGSDKNLEDVFLDILDELKEIPTSLRELEKKNSKVIESITTAILKLEKELENTNDPKKQQALIQAIAELKGEGQAAIDKSAADAPKEAKGPTSIKELLAGLMGITPESKKAAGGSSLKAFASALKKDARATFGLDTPDAPVEPETIEEVLEEKRVQKKIEGAIGDERGRSMESSYARKEKTSNRNDDTEDTAKATPNKTKTPQSSIFDGADSGSDTSTPDNKLLDLVTNIDETTTKILGAIESLDLSGGGFGDIPGVGGGGGSGNKKKPPFKPRKPVPPINKGSRLSRFGRLLKGKTGYALAAAAVVGTTAYFMNKDDPEEEGAEEEGTESGEPTAVGAEGRDPTAVGAEGEGMSDGAGAAIGAGVGVAALGGAALYARSRGNEDSDGSGAAAPERRRDAKGRFKSAKPTPSPSRMTSRIRSMGGPRGPGVMSRVSNIASRFGKSGLGRGLGVAGKFAGRAAVPLAVGMEIFSAGSSIMETNRAEAAGEITRKQANQAKGKTLGGATGGLAGAGAGAAAGAAIGSFVPIIGTAIGGLIGGAAGYYLGKKAGETGGEALVKGLSKDPEAITGDPSGRLAYANAVEGSTVPTRAAASVINNTTNVNNVTNGGQSSQEASISLRDTHSSYMRFRDNRMSRVM
jgi:hypothetical protein